MSADGRTRILVLGGGFGGVSTAQALCQHFTRDHSVEITLVNRDNHFVFVPLLASAAAGSIEALHVVAPIRQLIPGVQFRAEEVVAIDTARRVVATRSAVTSRERELPYDHLVLALGNVVNLAKLPGVAQHGKPIKTLGDALAIRNHVLQMLEAADIETQPETRREMLTFVVAGGGFSGVEMVGELNDMLREARRHYPSISEDQIKVILLHSSERILPEMSAEMADYALKELRRRGVEVRLNARLAGATPREAVLEGGRKIPTRTLIVAVGNAPPPALESVQVEKQRGKIVVDEFLRAPGLEGVWALGDNAIVPNRAWEDGRPCPPTAQFALRQGKLLAQNIAASLRGRSLKPFYFRGLGLLCLLGHGAGMGELAGGIKLRGLLGWLAWRSVYWSKSPGIGRKLQIGFDWFVDLFLPRDIAQINLARSQNVGQAHFEAGEYIFRQGDPGDHFYLIARGEVEVVREHSSGEERVLARLGRGEYFGETALLRGTRRNASVRCLTPVDVVTLARDDFATLASAWLQLGASVQRVSEQRLAAAPLTTWIPRPDQAEVDSAPSAPPPARVVVLRRSDSGAEIVLDRDLLSLGRSPDNNIVIADPTASRRHALIQRQGDKYWIEDLGGPNGTLVNGQRIAERTPLRGGDIIQIGRSVFTVVAPEEVPNAPASRQSAAPARPE